MKQHLIAYKKKEEKDNALLQAEREATTGSNQPNEKNKLSDKERAHLLRVKASLDNFVQRKRDKQQYLIDEAQQLCHTKIECFSKRKQRWEHGQISTLRVKW